MHQNLYAQYCPILKENDKISTIKKVVEIKNKFNFLNFFNYK